MGNDNSKLKGLEIDKKAVETNDFWSVYNAQNDEKIISVFIGENIVHGQLWVLQTPLQRAIKNLMIFRHPFILKYITSWDQHLATERIQPLSSVLQCQTDIQICLGLKNILCALIFLIEQAKSRHLNVSIGSIYVNNEGDWHLGGFEYVWKTKDFNKNILELAKQYRYKPSIDPNELTKFSQYTADGLEQYAFATLCEEILKSSKNIDTPYVIEFRDYCATHLKHQNIIMRPKLSAVLLHPYFNHEFILIHTFLTELPLKNSQEKQDFFSCLIDRLKYFDETIVASQIGGLLLSRMVLLDTTAQNCVTPFVLKAKSETSSALFSSSTYSNFIIPKIKKIFFVRDVQIRLILLTYFSEYVKLMTQDELQRDILPNLLLGIKDTNDTLVAKTLRCLADLVPILGSSAVIGGNRGRLFGDGRPQGIITPSGIRKISTSAEIFSDEQNLKDKRLWSEPRSITPVLNSATGLSVAEYLGNSMPDCNESFISPLLMIDDSINSQDNDMLLNATLMDDDDALHTNILTPIMTERLSPDGGEDVDIPAANDLDLDGNILSEDADDWSDWDNNDNENSKINENASCENDSNTFSKDTNHIIPINDVQKSNIENDQKNTTRIKLKTIVDDINDFDIKVQKIPKKSSDEFDFFKDMEPVIRSNISLIADESSALNEDDGKLLNEVVVDKTRFEFKVSEINTESGWDYDDTGDWGE